MICERALNILLNVKSGFDIKVSQEEIEELHEYGFITLFELLPSKNNLDEKLEKFKQNFILTSAKLRDLSKELTGNKRELNQLVNYKKLFGLLSAKKIIKIKLNSKKIKNQLLKEEIQLYFFKNRILNLNAEKRAFKNAIKVNGNRISLTPIGDTYINEIQARKRFFSRDLIELINLIKKIDDQYSMLLEILKDFMIMSHFTPIWGLYLINMEMTNLKTDFNRIADRTYWGEAQKKMMNRIINQLIDPTNIQSKNIKRILNQYDHINPEYKINSLISHSHLSRSEHNIFNEITSFLGNLFVALHIKNNESDNEIMRFLDNLERQSQNFKLSSYATTSALLLLAFSSNPEKYLYFSELLIEMPNGKEIFSAIATLFPWDAEETWMLLLRAESAILRAQSAKFIPELIVFALLLTMNPNILNIENNFEKKDYERWRYLIIPTIHLFNYKLLEKGFETYIKSRPLAYIISPRYRRHSSLHYHRIG